MQTTSNNDALNIYSNTAERIGDPLMSTAEAHCGAVERVIHAMHERLDEPLSLHDMSMIAFISPYHFNRIFRQITGIPPCQFLYALRLQMAKRLLLTTDVSVTDVCYDVGYNSLGTFTRRFTDLVGLSPSRFRALAHTAPESIFGHAPNPLDSASAFPAKSNAAISGSVTVPAGFNGAIFVGLFTTPIPQSEPISGTMLTQAGSYSLPAVPDGLYYILAAGLPFSEDPREYFLYESCLRGGGPAIVISNGTVKGSTDISLRPPGPFDPPILITLPLMLAKLMYGAPIH
jgi:AraC-like DNA-binding protein